MRTRSRGAGWRRPWDGERSSEGAAAVEFAILTPLIFMILFGMLTGGMAWNSKQTLTFSAREGARHGATLALEPDMNTWLDKVGAHTVNAAEPDLSLSDEEATVCVAYVGDSTYSRIQTGSAAPTYGATACYIDGRGSEPRVQVQVTRTVLLNAVMVQANPELEARATARHELTAAP